MRIAFLAEACALLVIAPPIAEYAAAIWVPAAHGETGDAKPLVARLASGDILQLGTRGNRTTLDIVRPGIESGPAALHALLERDSTVPETAPVVALRVIGEVPAAAIVLSDTYRSIPGGLSFCQAGKEQFLRVISIAHQNARETLRLKIASCRDNVELASPGIEWNQETATLNVHWLMGPDGRQRSEDRTYKVGTDGRAELIRGD